jgi:hypothetical protein
MRTIATAVFALTVAAPAAAHHSDAGIDMKSMVTLDGTVTEFHWGNPHVYFMVETIGEHGEPVVWSVQMGSTITTARTGWHRDYLQTGEHVVVQAHPRLDGKPYAILESLAKEGDVSAQTTVPGSSETAVPLPDGTARSDSLAGIWLADRAKIKQYPGGFDGYFAAELKLTPKAAAAKAAYDPLSPENPESQCIGRPTPGFIVSSQLYPIRIAFNEAERTATISSEFWDEVRTVYMDGRAHPANGERTLEGHSIGWWEDDVLVVDTRNFADHRSPYQIGVPSGAQKHVVERYRLIDEGRRVLVEFTLEDPEYLTAPLTHRRELVYAPDMTPERFNCDAESTRRFLVE